VDPKTAVRKHRTQKTLTQQALADSVGVSRQTIIAIEKGGYTPSVTLALRLARALETSVEALFWLENGEQADEKTTEAKLHPDPVGDRAGAGDFDWL
jgi:putative transcriptional regulator